jgi:N-acetylmuramoyl-L-alanine amidase
MDQARMPTGSCVDLPSPNQEDRPAGTAIDMLILHYTGMRSGQDALERLRDPAPPTGVPVSSHYVVEKDGTVFRLVPEHRRARHAGLSSWRGWEGLNDRSIGIEIVNAGHEWGYEDFPPAQINAVTQLSRDILSRHPCPARNVVGHSDVAPDRKQDPGEKFPWQVLAAQGVGLWPAVPDAGTGDAAADADQLEAVRMRLRHIGYRVPQSDPDGEALRVVLRAFQRHWRPEAVTGLADLGTRTRLTALQHMLDGSSQ